MQLFYSEPVDIVVGGKPGILFLRLFHIDRLMPLEYAQIKIFDRKHQIEASPSYTFNTVQSFPYRLTKCIIRDTAAVRAMYLWDFPITGLKNYQHHHRHWNGVIHSELVSAGLLHLAQGISFSFERSDSKSITFLVLLDDPETSEVQYRLSGVSYRESTEVDSEILIGEGSTESIRIKCNCRLSAPCWKIKFSRGRRHGYFIHTHCWTLIKRIIGPLAEERLDVLVLAMSERWTEYPDGLESRRSLAI